ncbi:unnamed protein product [Parnassius apollo]|uniref:(apollo) hypothetical protein n=1 Tax=Parnassius apollo TaxID=110799 RepID=A0A8S3WNQ2_PARAO|nr:unnamed protein product [Parnassius apollo]
MNEYEVDFFKSLIEERPVLWDTSNRDYKNTFLKQEAWKNIDQVGSSGLNSFQAESEKLNKEAIDGSSRRDVQDKDNIWHGWSPAALKTKMSDALVTKKGEPNMASQEKTKTKGFNS